MNLCLSYVSKIWPTFDRKMPTFGGTIHWNLARSYKIYHIGDIEEGSNNVGDLYNSTIFTQCPVWQIGLHMVHIGLVCIAWEKKRSTSIQVLKHSGAQKTKYNSQLLMSASFSTSETERTESLYSMASCIQGKLAGFFSLPRHSDSRHYH